jgi:predicted HTH transcriptional regulator
MATRDPIEVALAASKESRRIEFKSEFEPTQVGAWCEILKDIAALANSGGGIILFGVDDSGDPTGWNPRPLLSVDSADISNQIIKYTGENFDDF